MKPAFLTVLDLDMLAPHRRVLAAALSPRERDRVARLRWFEQRARFVLRRGALRYLLAAHQRVDPATLQFEAGYDGKPSLANGAVLPFNASSSLHLAALVVAPQAAVGVDIECRRPFPGWRAIAARFLPAPARSYLDGLPDAEREDAFLRLWTAVEAATKLTGEPLHAHPTASARAAVTRTVAVGERAWVSLASERPLGLVPDDRLPALLAPAVVPWGTSTIPSTRCSLRRGGSRRPTPTIRCCARRRSR